MCVVLGPASQDAVIKCVYASPGLQFGASHSNWRPVWVKFRQCDLLIMMRSYGMVKLLDILNTRSHIVDDRFKFHVKKWYKKICSNALIYLSDLRTSIVVVPLTQYPGNYWQCLFIGSSGRVPVSVSLSVSVSVSVFSIVCYHDDRSKELNTCIRFFLHMVYL